MINYRCTSIVVAAELRFGAEKRGSAKLPQQLEIILSELQILPLEEPADHHYATLRHKLEKQGKPIGPNDMLIAAQVLTHNLVVVTANSKEFSRVPDLAADDWLDNE